MNNDALSGLYNTTSYNTGNITYVGDGLINQLTNSFTIQNAINDNMTDEQIKDRMQSLVKDFTELLDLIEKRRLNNEQWCLDGMDELNKQSVRF